MSVVGPFPWHGDPAGPPVVFGVLPHQDPIVVQAAAAFTARLGGALVCLWADGSHITVEYRPDGAVVTTPMDPDGVDGPDRPAHEDRLHTQLELALGESEVPWQFRYATGAPPRALHEAAEELEAVAIAIGTRKPGFGHWAAEKIDGSVAERLAHHQHRPVILLPHPAAGRSGARP